MKPLVKVCEGINCALVITDITQDSDEYIDEHIINTKAWHEKNKFKYSETYTLNIIYKHTTQSDTIISGNITEHCSYLDEEHIQLKEDGYYTIDHIILPSKEVYDASIDLDWYVCDGVSIYQVCNGNFKEITFDTLATLVESDEMQGTTISGVSLPQFSICHLNQCYVNKCKAVFKNLSVCHSNDIYYERDIVWMAINVIKYYVELGELLSAQQLLESLNYCGEICGEYKSSVSSCGCSK